MFDFGFSEMLVIGTIALVVLGPERLPTVARTAGSGLGRRNDSLLRSNPISTEKRNSQSSNEFKMRPRLSQMM